MTVFFDTSALVPLLFEDHPHHEASSSAYFQVPKRRGYCASHNLAEVYATLTRMPPPYRAGSDQAILFVTDLRDRLNVIALDVNEHFVALRKLAAMDVTGGATYDGLLAHCALKAKVDIIYTWNTRHFQRLGPEVETRLRVPGSASNP